MAEILDSHIHIRGYHDLASTLGIMERIAEIEHLKGWSVLSLSGWDRDSAAQNALCITCKALYPGCRAYAGLDHFRSGLDRSPEGRLEQAKTFLAMGFDGLKLIESKPSSRKLLPEGLNSATYEPMFEYLEREQIPITWHVADPEENWDESKCDQYAKEHGWFYGDGTHLSLQEIYAEVFEVLERHPNLNVTFAHFFFLSKNRKEAERLLERYPNVCLDFTPGQEMFYNFDKDYEGWRDFFLRRSGRLILGTDNGWGDEPTPDEKVTGGCSNLEILRTYFTSSGPVKVWNGVLRGMALPEAALSRIFSENYERITRKARPVDVETALSYCRELLAGIRGMGIRPEASGQLEECIQILESLRNRAK